jgi:hypothetical protein
MRVWVGLIAVLGLFSAVQGAHAAQLVPFYGMYINESTSFTNGFYNLSNVSGLNYYDGAIRINTSNIILDCNNSVINGSYLSFYGISLNGKENVSIVNCSVSNYLAGIFVNGSNVSNVINSTTNMTGMGIYVLNSTNSLILGNHDNGS